MNLFDRFKKFKAENWIICVIMLITTICISSYTIACISTIASGKTLFGGKDSTNFFLKNADILMTVLFSILSLIMFETFVYTTFFKKIDEKEATRKIIDHGKVVEVSDENKKQSKNSIPQSTKIDKNKLKDLEDDLENSESDEE